MATIARKTTTYRWICTNKDLCEQVDDQIREYVHTLGQLSRMVADGKISGLDCNRGEARLLVRLKDLRDARKTLWRRVPVTIEEVSTVETAEHLAVADQTHEPDWKQARYVSKFPKPSQSTPQGS